MTRRAWRSLAATTLVLLLSTIARAQSPDWNAVAEESVIEVLTQDPDGELRDTKVWLAVVDGQGYVRTGDTRWRANLERNPDTVLRIAGHDYPVHAVHATDPALIARVNAVFREKYGFTDRVLGWFGNPANAYFIAMVARPPAP